MTPFTHSVSPPTPRPAPADVFISRPRADAGLNREVPVFELPEEAAKTPTRSSAHTTPKNEAEASSAQAQGAQHVEQETPTEGRSTPVETSTEPTAELELTAAPPVAVPVQVSQTAEARTQETSVSQFSAQPTPRDAEAASGQSTQVVGARVEIATTAADPNPQTVAKVPPVAKPVVEIPAADTRPASTDGKPVTTTAPQVSQVLLPEGSVAPKAQPTSASGKPVAPVNDTSETARTSTLKGETVSQAKPDRSPTSVTPSGSEKPLSTSEKLVADLVNVPKVKPVSTDRPTLRQANTQPENVTRDTLAARLNQADGRASVEGARAPLVDRVAVPENVAPTATGKGFAPSSEVRLGGLHVDSLIADSKALTEASKTRGMGVAEESRSPMKASFAEPDARPSIASNRGLGSPVGGSSLSGFGSGMGGSSSGQGDFAGGQHGGRDAPFERGQRAFANGASSEATEASGRTEKTFQNPSAQRAAEVVPAVMQQIERLRRSGAERLNVRLPLEDGQAIELRLRLLGGNRVEVRVEDAPESLRQSLRDGWSQLADEASAHGLQVDIQWGGEGSPNLSSRFA